MSYRNRTGGGLLTAALPAALSHDAALDNPLIGVLQGEGVGSEIIAPVKAILQSISDSTPYRFELEFGGKIGLPSVEESGRALSDDVIRFCQDIFQRNGVVLCGPGGGRFVYQLRNEFELFCKFTPIQPLQTLLSIGVVKPEAKRDVDIVVVRENTGGLYFGDWAIQSNGEHQLAYHRFEYSEKQVERILDVSIRLAASRRGRLTLVVKPGGVPSISTLWSEKLKQMEIPGTVECQVLEVDNAAYQMIANAGEFDVIVAPNMFGDVLSDNGALLLGSRGLSYSGNFGLNGEAVYQTGHGAAHDLAGKNTANPIAQIFSLSMMLRESFGLIGLAGLIDEAVESVLAQGFRTRDIAETDSKIVATDEMGRLVLEAFEARLVPQLAVAAK